MSDLAGRRVMVVEDELLIAMLIEDVLTEHGCVVVGPFNTVAAGLQAAGEVVVDAALLDVNLRGEKVFPVAEALEARGIPFVLLSGYGSDAVPLGRTGWRACSKPFQPEELVRVLSEQMATDSQVPG